jgi:hypothetical protein
MISRAREHQFSNCLYSAEPPTIPESVSFRSARAFALSGTTSVNTGYGGRGLAGHPQQLIVAPTSVTAPGYPADPSYVTPSPSVVAPGATYYSRHIEYPTGDHSAFLDEWASTDAVGDGLSTDRTPPFTLDEYDQAASMVCKWEGCKYRGEFKRKVDLLRHVKLVHISPGGYSCSVEGCVRVFNRKDNRDAHLRRVHEHGDASQMKKSKKQRTTDMYQ